MTLQVKQNAPDFNTHDVFGNPISLQKHKEKTVYLAFMRFAGCPVCNLRVHNLLKHADAFKAKNIEVVLVYESSLANIRQYLEGSTYPFIFVADPESTLYNAYQVEKSWAKLMGSMFKGMLGKVRAGEKLFGKKPAMDGSMNRMEAEFVIDKNGKLAIAHYSAFLGDNIDIEKILNL